jgi:hypothetical protein
VQGSEDDLDGGLLLALDDVDRDPTTVVGDPAAAVGQELDDDPIAVAGHGLVDRVVHDLVDEVMEPAWARGSDVHAGTLSDRVEALQDRDVLSCVRSLRSSLRGRRGPLRAVPGGLGRCLSRGVPPW